MPRDDVTMARNGRCFLNVETSITGRRWVDRLADSEAADALSAQYGLPDMVARVLAARGVSLDGAARFFEPTLRELMPDPLSLTDMGQAAERIAGAVRSGEKICVFGDYDVDGASAAALLCRYLGQLGDRPEIYIPDRLTEGYGPSEAAFRRLIENGNRLIITVDCGIAAHDPIAYANSQGVDVIVVDHHLVDAHLPRAHAVVNPNRADDPSGLGFLCATGVVFLVLAALNRLLREHGWFDAGPKEPDLLNLLDLVALATICDVVPLLGINRAFVAQGLKIVSRRSNPGLAALADVAGLKRRPDVHALGYVLGPRINAGGRMGSSDLGALLLSGDDKSKAARLAAELHRLNRDRQMLEDSVLVPALLQAEQALGEQSQQNTVTVSGDNWHAGVLGIVASRLKDRFQRPAIVIGFNGTMGTGSGRSIPGVDLGRAVCRARDEGLLATGGGHVMAAGLTMERSKLGPFRSFLEDALKDEVAAAQEHSGLKIDGALSAGAAGLDLISLLEKAGPYGAGHPVPRFAFPAHRVVYADYVGTGHIRCTLVSGDGSRLKAIAFRAADGPLGEALMNERHLPLHIAGTLNRDDWGGAQKAQLFIEDAAKPTT